MSRTLGNVVPRSLVWATDVDALPLDRLVDRRDGYLVARSPSNPTHFWGNLLLFDDPPARGDGARWERLFEVEFGNNSEVRHYTFAWDHTGGALGAAREEFLAPGYEIEQTIGLLAAPHEIRAHPRENRDVAMRALDPRGGVDDELWVQVLEMQVAGRGEHFAEEPYRVYSERRQSDLRELFQRGRGGAWYVALEPRSGEVAGSCGIVVTDARGRFQSVDTAPASTARAARPAQRPGAESALPSRSAD